MVAAAKAKGWTEESADSLLDVLGNFEEFEEVDSEYPTLGEAVNRGVQLINAGRDFFGQVSVEELQYRLTVPADNFYSWEVVTRYNVDETGIVESIDCETDY
jgi:hypothetical protein